MIFFHDIITLLSPFHGLMFMIERLPQAKAWGYLLPPLRGEIRTTVVSLNLVAVQSFHTSGQAPVRQVELKSTPLASAPVVNRLLHHDPPEGSVVQTALIPHQNQLLCCNGHRKELEVLISQRVYSDRCN
jgi:hypothetical protein